MKLLYLHNTPYNNQKANFVGVLSMCNAFSEVGIDTTLSILDSGVSKNQITQLVSLAKASIKASGCPAGSRVAR